MSLVADGQREVLRINHIMITGNQGVGVYRFILMVKCHTKIWQEKKYSLTNFSCEVNAIKSGTNQSGYIGTARLKTPIILESPSSVDNVHEITLNLILDLSPHQIEKIEEMRDGEDLRFSAILNCEIIVYDASNTYQERVAGFQERNIQATQSDWGKCLEKMGYGKFLLLEIPIPDSKSKVPEKVLNHLKSAQSKFKKGEYDECVARCRDAHDRLNEYMKDKNELFNLARKNIICDAEKSKKMSKSERLLHIRYATREFTHMAKHTMDDEDSKEISFTRNEARLLLVQTASIITFYFNNN